MHRLPSLPLQLLALLSNDRDALPAFHDTLQGRFLLLFHPSHTISFRELVHAPLQDVALLLLLPPFLCS